MDQIKNEIRAYIIENFLFGDDHGLDESTSFLANGIIDSTGILELVAFLEEKYAIRIDDEELLPEHLDSIDKAAVFVSRKRGGR